MKKILDLIEMDNVEKVVEEFNKKDNINLSLLLCYAAEKNSCKVIEALLRNDGVDPSFGRNFAIRIANKMGNEEAKELLLADSRVDSAVLDNDEALPDIGELKKQFEGLAKVNVTSSVEQLSYGREEVLRANFEKAFGTTYSRRDITTLEERVSEPVDTAIEEVTEIADKTEVASEENSIDVNEEVEVEDIESEAEGDLELPEVEDDLDFLDIPEEEEIENFDTEHEEENVEENFKEIDANVKKVTTEFVTATNEEIKNLHNEGKMWVPDFLKKSDS